MCECKKENPQSLQGAFMRLLHRYTEVNFGRLKDMGVHPGQLPFLNIISHKEGISQRELAECLHVKPPTVAVTVKRLEKADVIYRRPDPNDMRISRIYLTEKGIRISAQIEVVIQENEKVLTAEGHDKAGKISQKLGRACRCDCCAAVFAGALRSDLAGIYVKDCK